MRSPAPGRMMSRIRSTEPPASMPCNTVLFALKVAAGMFGSVVYCSNWSRTSERYAVKSQLTQSRVPRVPSEGPRMLRGERHEARRVAEGLRQVDEVGYKVS